MTVAAGPVVATDKVGRADEQGGRGLDRSLPLRTSLASDRQRTAAL